MKDTNKEGSGNEKNQIKTTPSWKNRKAIEEMKRHTAIINDDKNVCWNFQVQLQFSKNVELSLWMFQKLNTNNAH